MKKTSVGLVVLTNLPSMGGWVAILQRRGEFNNEKMGPESWPGACQITVHGECKDGEILQTALVREIKEEIGTSLGFNVGTTVELTYTEDSDKIVASFGMRVIPKWLELFRLHAGTGGLKFVTREQVDNIVSIKDFDKTIGVKDRDVIAMFPDEIITLQRAFRKLVPPQE